MTNNQEIQYVKDTFEEYLTKRDHISSSEIKDFLKSPRTYYYEKYEKVRKEDGRHFALGSAMHELILEPELFRTNYLVAPKVDRRTKEGKAIYETFVEAASGKVILFEDELEMILKVVENSMKHQTFIDLMKESYREMSCYTTDEKTGLKIRLRPDVMPANDRRLCDVKSCLDSSPRKFLRDALEYGYHISAAYYMDFLNREEYLFAAMEKQQPHQVTLYAMQDKWIEQGRNAYRMGLDLLKWSMDNNFWCNHNEFEILKECYATDSLDTFFETLVSSQLITII